MTKKILCSAVLLAGLFGGTVFAQTAPATKTPPATQTSPAAGPFKDISPGNADYTAIKYLKQNDLIDGYDDGTFRPLQEINRAEALKMLAAAVSGPRTTNPAVFSFSDIKKSDWFYPYILDAWNNFLAAGYSDGLFHPEKTINVAESLKIVLKKEGKPIPPAPDTPSYNDVGADAWYAPYAAVAKDRTLIPESRGAGDLFPSQNMNRGSFAELLYHLIMSSQGSKFGRATWYADSLAQMSTASRELYIPTNLTAAHLTLPFNTRLLVTNLANGKSVEVRVNDRGPYVTGVALDLSKSAFAAIASTGAGIIDIEYKVLADGQAANPATITYGF